MVIEYSGWVEQVDAEDTSVRGFAIPVKFLVFHFLLASPLTTIRNRQKLATKAHQWLYIVWGDTSVEG